MVITLWYRCPELLLGETLYGPEVDMWSLGCMFAEILNLEVLFQGQGEVDQLNRIFKLLGVPNGGNWEGFEKLPHANTFSFKGPKGSKLREAFPSNSFSGKTYLNDGGERDSPWRTIQPLIILTTRFFVRSYGSQGSIC